MTSCHHPGRAADMRPLLAWAASIWRDYSAQQSLRTALDSIGMRIMVSFGHKRAVVRVAYLW
jgi:hypothetical protein